MEPSPSRPPPPHSRAVLLINSARVIEDPKRSSVALFRPREPILPLLSMFAASPTPPLVNFVVLLPLRKLFTMTSLTAELAFF